MTPTVKTPKGWRRLEGANFPVGDFVTQTINGQCYYRRIRRTRKQAARK